MCRKFCFILALFITLSCNNKPQPVNTEIIVNIEDSTIISRNRVYAKYKIPLPLDLFRYFLKDAEFSDEFLIPLDLGDKCIDDKHKALVLGIANTDLAFCAVTNHNQLSSQYFEMSQNLAKDLGIDVGYTEELYRRFIDNIDNADSIQKLADEAYWKTCNYLESNNKYNILPFMVVSGWYESVYLLIKSKNAEIYSDEVKYIILKQEDGFKRVQKFLYDAQLQTTANYYYQDIKKIIQNIQKILDLYKLYYANVSERENNYNKLISTIFQERSNFINGNL